MLNAFNRSAPRFGSPCWNHAIRRAAPQATGGQTRGLLRVAAAIAVVASAGPAAADTAASFSKTTIAYRVSEIATPEGARSLMQRIDRAALRLCRRASPSVFERRKAADVETCRAEATSRAVAQLPSPGLMASR